MQKVNIVLKQLSKMFSIISLIVLDHTQDCLSFVDTLSLDKHPRIIFEWKSPKTFLDLKRNLWTLLVPELIWTHFVKSTAETLGPH